MSIHLRRLLRRAEQLRTDSAGYETCTSKTQEPQEAYAKTEGVNQA